MRDYNYILFEKSPVIRYTLDASFQFHAEAHKKSIIINTFHIIYLLRKYTSLTEEKNHIARKILTYWEGHCSISLFQLPVQLKLPENLQLKHH